MTAPIWTIEKDTTHGTTFALHVGPLGIPGSHSVTGLSRAQGEALGDALRRVEEVSRFRALAAVREALEIV